PGKSLQIPKSRVLGQLLRDFSSRNCTGTVLASWVAYFGEAEKIYRSRFKNRFWQRRLCLKFLDFIPFVKNNVIFDRVGLAINLWSSLAPCLLAMAALSRRKN